MVKLYLDDKRTPTEEGWTVVRNYQEFIDYLHSNPMPDYISFDHDLAREHYHNDMYKGLDVYKKHYLTFKHPTGFSCAKALIKMCMMSGNGLPTCNVHSANPAGSQMIADVLSIAIVAFDQDLEITKEIIPHVQ